MAVRLGYLGPLEVDEDGRALSLPSGRARALLLLLAVHANELVSSDRLVEDLWSGRPPASAAKVVQKYVSQLRRSLPAGTIVTRGPGYVLVVDETDAGEFERLVREASGQATAQAAVTARRALTLWRGKPLAEVEYENWAQLELQRLDELRAVATELRIDADLELGRHAQLVPELEELVAEHPYRERLRGQLMLALYRSGRQADALAVYRQGRREMGDQLGLEPSPLLEQLAKQILNHDDELEAGGSAGLPSGTVTLLFTDIEGSTRLLKRLGERYGDVLAATATILRAAAEKHGGREVDNQGDSFFFAFARAKAALAAAVVAQLELADHAWPDGVEVRVRMGLHTGEPAVGEQRYIGLGVHRAARIGAVAHGGQVLLSNATRELVEDEVAGVSVRELGSYRLKDIDRPERLFQLDIEGLQATFPPLRANRVRAEQVRPAGRRPILIGAFAGVLAALAAIPVFALSSGGRPHAAKLHPLATNGVGILPSTSSHVERAVPLEGAPNALASGAGSVWVALSDRGTVLRIDPATDTVQQTIATGGSPAAIAVGDGFVWVADSLAGTVSEIDPRTNGGQKVASIDVGNGPTGIAHGLGAVWVANSLDDTVVRIDPTTGATSKPISVEGGADAIAAGQGAIWVVGESAGVLSRIDPATRSVVGTTNVGSRPVAVATSPGAVWVANSQDGTIAEIAPDTGQPKGLISVGTQPSGVAVSADGHVWVSNEGSSTVSEIDSAAGRVVKTVTVGAAPQAVTLKGATVYVAVQGASTAHHGGTLTLAIANPPGFYEDPIPASLDPSAGYAAWELLTMTNDGLLGYARTGGASSYKVVPDLAVALPTVSDGGRTYTFELRDGVRYSTGRQVRPADIRRGIERALISSKGNAPGAYLSSIVGASGCMKSASQCDLTSGIVASPGSSVILFHLTAPDPDFLYKLALPTFDAVPASTPLKARLPLPATGPYKIAGYRSKRGVIQLVRNPRFRVWSTMAQPAGYPDQIVERYSYTGSTATRAVADGTADITADGLDQTWSPSTARLLQTRYSSQLYAAPLLTVLGLWLNTRLPPFNDVRVRRAFNYAVNRKTLAEINGGTIASGVTCQILPANIDGYVRYCPYTLHPNAAGTYTGPDLAKARRLVAASGTKGQRVGVWFYDIPVGRRNGAYFVSVLRGLGYVPQLHLVPHTGGTWRADRQAGIAGWGSDYPASGDVILPHFSCSAYHLDPNLNLNDAGFCDSRIDARAAQARTLQATNPRAASQLWTTVDRELTDRAPWIAIKAFLSTDFVSRRTGNYRYCWLSGNTGIVGACLDQLWVR